MRRSPRAGSGSPPRDAQARPGFLHELREGWQEFTSRTWLWASVVLFGIGNLAFAGWIVLGPAIADERPRRRGRLGDDPHRGWRRRGRREHRRDPHPAAAAARRLRARPRRCSRSRRSRSRSARPRGRSRRQRSSPGSGSPSTSRSGSRCSSADPRAARSRGWRSYDTLGSFVLMPLGMALVGPGGRRDRHHRRRCWIAAGRHVGLAGRRSCALPSVWAIAPTRAVPAAACRRPDYHPRLDERPRSHGPVPDRLPPHRRRAHVPLQLALRARPWRRVPAADREHRHEPRGAGGDGADPALARAGSGSTGTGR